MAVIKPTNFAKAIVSSPPSGTGGLSFSVAAGKGALFPSPGANEYFYGCFTNAARSAYEIVKIESRSTDSFTIDAAGRGVDGTTAATWTASDIFFLPTTRAMWDDIGVFGAAAQALADVTPAADRVPYFTSATAASVAPLTAYARTILDDADAATARGTLVVYSTAQVDALVAALWTTGDVKPTFKTTADSGWVMMDDGTIGNAASGGTTRANADTEALFTLFWNNTLDADCAVSTGRGANAAADFAANKTIALPKTLGRELAIAGSGSGLTARALASVLGTETKTIITANLPASGLSIPSLSVSASGSMSGTVTTNIAGGTPSNGDILQEVDAGAASTVPLSVSGSVSGSTGTGTTGNMGSGTAMDVMTPRFHANVMVKL